MDNHTLYTHNKTVTKKHMTKQTRRERAFGAGVRLGLEAPTFHREAPVSVPSTPPPIQLPPAVPQDLGPCHPPAIPELTPTLPALTWPSPCCCQQQEELSFSLALSLCVSKTKRSYNETGLCVASPLLARLLGATLCL